MICDWRNGDWRHNCWVYPIQTDTHRSSVLIRMGKVAAQTGNRPFQMIDAVHDLFELEFNAHLAGWKSFQVLEEQVFDVLGDGVGPRSI